MLLCCEECIEMTSVFFRANTRIERGIICFLS
jgi:hypothetical protein